MLAYVEQNSCFVRYIADAIVSVDSAAGFQCGTESINPASPGTWVPQTSRMRVQTHSLRRAHTMCHTGFAFAIAYVADGVFIQTHETCLSVACALC